MSHNINEDRVMVVGRSAWHGIGVTLENPVTAVEAIKFAKLDYTVETQPMFAECGKKVPNKFAMVRSDNQNVLGIVGEKYKIIQNVDAFNFFDVLVGEGQAIYHTAGALGLGERIWLSAKLPNDIVIKKDDNVEKFLLLTTSHDGKTSLKMFFTPVRVVCQNTLNMALSDANGISIRHHGNIQSKIEAARKTLGIAINYYNQFEKIAKQFNETKMNDELTDEYFDSVLGINDIVPEEVTSCQENKKQKLIKLYRSGTGNNGETLWDAYNAVTEYVDHEKTIRNIDDDQSKKLNDIWFGYGAQIKDKAFSEAVKLVNS